jgi:hypothetical protein
MYVLHICIFWLKTIIFIYIYSFLFGTFVEDVFFSINNSKLSFKLPAQYGQLQLGKLILFFPFFQRLTQYEFSL